MPRQLSVQDSVVIAVDPQTIYAQVADPSQMARWSPENTGAEVPAPGEPATVGTEFVGSNRRGRARWATRCRVIASDPGERFAFDVFQIGTLRRPVIKARIARWDYRFEAVDGGTKVTEIWSDGRRRWPDAVARVFDPLVTGGHMFDQFQRRNIAKTLARLKADLEAQAA